MVSEVFAGISSFKAMLDIAKALKSMNDATARNSAVIELQEKILAAQEAQATLLDQKRDLEKEMAKFEAWEAEKQRYDLKDLGWGSFAYMLKPEARGTHPPHWICTNCYGNRRISLIQWGVPPGSKGRKEYFCPACHTEINPSSNAIELGTQRARWLD